MQHVAQPTRLVKRKRASWLLRPRPGTIRPVTSGVPPGSSPPCGGGGSSRGGGDGSGREGRNASHTPVKKTVLPGSTPAMSNFTRGTLCPRGRCGPSIRVWQRGIQLCKPRAIEGSPPPARNGCDRPVTRALSKHASTPTTTTSTSPHDHHCSQPLTYRSPFTTLLWNPFPIYQSPWPPSRPTS